MKTAIVWFRRDLQETRAQAVFFNRDPDPFGRRIEVEWIPELRDVPPEKLAEPPGLGQRLAKNYPAPIVDHARAREKALELFGRYKITTDGMASKSRIALVRKA